MGTISGYWKIIKFVCGNHGEDYQEMKLASSGSRSFVYKCEKSNAINLTIDEERCPNAIPLFEYEKAVEYISDILIKADENDQQIKLTNYTWTKKTMKFKILKHTEEEIIVSFIDEKLCSIHK